jgi:predicted enzyme related to lactoylglutathione lyase
MSAAWSKASMATLVPIRNMNRAIRFYTKSLGAKLSYRGMGEMKDSWAQLKLGREILWLIEPTKYEKRTLAYQTFLVKNIRAAVSELKRKGVKFQKAQRGSKEGRIEGPISFEPFGASAFFKDSEGNLLMVWQNEPPM